LPFGSLIKQYFYPILGVLLLLVLGYTHYKAQEFGYSRAETKYIKEISEINSKSADLLEKQKEEHDRFVEKQDKLLNNLKSDNERLSKIVRENEEQSAKEPDANDPGIGKSRVMRLNRIR